MSTEIQKWADPAMYAAEPLVAADGPRVYLLAMTPDPLGAVAAMAKMYKGEVVRDLAGVTDDERREYFEQIQRTKLQAPFEAVKLHFMIEGVTRSFTHQMVRQRTAAYAQESLRFAVKEDMAEGVALPPSLMGTMSHKEWQESKARRDWDDLAPMQRARLEWDRAVEITGDVYNYLIEQGVPAEDARGLLPHNITTRLNYVTDLRALIDHGGNRLCTQAQFEWRAVFTRIVEAIRNYKEFDMTPGAREQMERMGWVDPSWQYELLASVFRPVCYLTGKCEFQANFDRPCKIRDRVQANAEIGRPSTEWHEPVDVGMPGIHNFIPAIDPAEWLADASAAR